MKNSYTLLLILIISITCDLKEETYTISDDSSSWNINSNEGSIIVLKLKGNPTTGYSWYLNDSNLDTSMIKPLNLNKYKSAEYKSEPHPEGFVGYGGTYYFKFEALKTGSTSCSFSYKRVWMKENNKTYNITFTIE